jgi:uncharacterized protein YecE (DUF72 family)
MTRSEVRIGCSGWEYRHWRGRFYPREISHDRWLEFYAERFDTVELNGTFYRLPEAATFDAWRQRAPAQFRYALKASRYLTHVRRLREPAEALDRLWSRAARLRDRLGPMLYQLPPRWHRNLPRLEEFLGLIPGNRLQAVEFRDPTWHLPETYEALERRGVALCLHDMPAAGAPQRPDRPIGPFAYVRFHGQAGTYAGAYPPQTLGAWARTIAAWTDAGLSVWAYFNNDVGGHAPRDAARLRDAVERHRSG